MDRFVAVAAKGDCDLDFVTSKSLLEPPIGMALPRNQMMLRCPQLRFSPA